MSNVNEKICRLFTEREVLAEVTEMVEYIFDSGTMENCPPFTVDDVEMEAEVVCPDCGAEAESLVRHLIDAEEVEPIFDPNGLADEQFLCPVCMTPHPVMEDAKQCCAGLEVYKCTECDKIISSTQYDEMTEVDTGHIFHWHLVTPWLMEKLRSAGEPVISNPPLWGRRRVSKDPWNEWVIEEVCSELEILEGQKHDWSKKF